MKVKKSKILLVCSVLFLGQLTFAAGATLKLAIIYSLLAQVDSNKLAQVDGSQNVCPASQSNSFLDEFLNDGNQNVCPVSLSDGFLEECSRVTLGIRNCTTEVADKYQKAVKAYCSQYRIVGCTTLEAYSLYEAIFFQKLESDKKEILKPFLSGIREKCSENLGRQCTEKDVMPYHGLRILDRKIAESKPEPSKISKFTSSLLKALAHFF